MANIIPARQMPVRHPFNKGMLVAFSDCEISYADAVKQQTPVKNKRKNQSLRFIDIRPLQVVWIWSRPGVDCKNIPIFCHQV